MASLKTIRTPDIEKLIKIGTPVVHPLIVCVERAIKNKAVFASLQTPLEPLNFDLI